MVILGVDPALTVTGYGVINFKNRKAALIKAGAIITTPRQELPGRLAWIYREVLKIISELQPQVLVLEKLYAHYRHPTTAYILGQARGIICLAAAVSKVSLVEYAATQVKKAVVGRGQASKFQVQRMVSALLNLKTVPRYNDVTDALALALTFTHYLKEG